MSPCGIVLFISLLVPIPVKAAEPVRLRVDFSKSDGSWTMPALALGQGGLQSDPMIEPHIKELRQLRPRTIRLFLSEYYRIYPDHGVYDWTKLDRELRAVRATGARPTLALAMKPPVLYPKVDHFIVHPSNFDEWERLCESLAKHCRDAKVRRRRVGGLQRARHRRVRRDATVFPECRGLQPVLHPHRGRTASGRPGRASRRSCRGFGGQFPG